MNSLVSGGSGSLAWGLKWLLTIIYWMTIVALALFALGIIIIMSVFAAGWLGVDFGGGAMSELVQNLRLLAHILPVALIELIVIYVVADRLRRIFGTLAAGDPFVPENAGHLRVIAVVIALFQIFRHITQGALALFLSLFGQPIVGGVELAVSWDVDLGAWLAVAALLVFAEVFREGARLRQEQKMTI
jgi:hypothetical protein